MIATRDGVPHIVNVVGRTHRPFSTGGCFIPWDKPYAYDCPKCGKRYWSRSENDVILASTPGLSVMHGPSCMCGNQTSSATWTPCLPVFAPVPKEHRTPSLSRPTAEDRRRRR